VVVLLSACGGGSGGSGSEAASVDGRVDALGASSRTGAGGTDAREELITNVQASRFLTQATFGPNAFDIDQVRFRGYSGWIDAEFAKPRTSHLAFWQAADAAIKLLNPANSAGQDEVFNSFWKSAVSGEDQLRQRVAFALSEIFVVSLVDSNVANTPGAVASYLDVLGTHSFGNFRNLLQDVSLHPMMATYLSSLRNQKDNPATGRVPDQNYAREVMQLFTIGLQELNVDGSLKLLNGLPIETYKPEDVAGLARVFTGWSWACPGFPASNCFFNGNVNNVYDPDRFYKSLVGYPAFHSPDVKTFLGVTIPVQSPANPTASLQVGLDTLFNHPNVGPFIGKQLIQRLVTSNPSAAYVGAVAAAFNNNGSGVRGDMRAVIKTILMHPEARVSTNTAGKVREPVLRLSAVLRGFGFASDSGNYRVGNTDNAGTQLSQTPLRSPSVFNYFRPGYIAPGTQSAALNLVVPELQLAHETTAAGYVNYMRDNISAGVGANNGAPLNRRDLQPNFTTELALAERVTELVDRMSDKLMYGTMPAALKTEIRSAVTAITIPAPNGSNQAAIDAAKRNRVNAAVFLTVVSPEFQVQK